MEKVIVKESNLDDVIKISKNVIEFNELTPTKDAFESRYKNLEKLIVVAYYNNIPIGYLIGYDNCDSDKSFYCWLAGVDYNYRRLGALKLMMEYQINWAKRMGYKKLKIKTRNKFREMLNFLVKNDFYFTDIEKQKDIDENRIYLELKL